MPASPDWPTWLERANDRLKPFDIEIFGPSASFPRILDRSPTNDNRFGWPRLDYNHGFSIVCSSQSLSDPVDISSFVERLRHLQQAMEAVASLPPFGAWGDVDSGEYSPAPVDKWRARYGYPPLPKKEDTK